MRRTINLFILTAIIFGLTSCMTNANKNDAGLVIPGGMSTEPSILPEYSAPRPAEGSLYLSGSSVFEDSKAAHVGDTVIVDIIENSSSSMNVNTEGTRKTGNSIGIPTLNIPGVRDPFQSVRAAGQTKIIGTDYLSEFEGEAKSDRSGQVTASIAARITEILPNGNLSLFGRRAMKVNNEVQYITVAGIVRPQDISSTNRVKSTYLADSRIEYYGKGALADKQKPGWGTRIIDNIWPW
jgi:flagellar L-ring protein precursor FlgH